jgi:hypothetical protein
VRIQGRQHNLTLTPAGAALPDKLNSSKKAVVKLN